MRSFLFISVFASIICLLAVQPAMAQSRTKARANSGAGTSGPMSVGSTTLNLGIGVGNEYEGDYYNSPFGMKAAAEWGLWHAGPGTITLGAELGTSFSNGGHYDDYRSNTTVIAMRSAWHYGWRVRGLDTYGGFSAGLGFHHYGYVRGNRYNYNKVIPVFGVFIGASYFVTPRFGFNAEAGADITNFQVGVIFKLK